MSETSKGFLLVLGAYLAWGLFPLFFKAMDHISALEILPHRIIWAVPTSLIVLLIMRRTGDIMPTLRAPAKVRMIAVAAALIAFNWGVYVYSILSEQALQASLGYFISPLISVMIGFFLLGEKLSVAKGLAIALALVGVVVQTIEGGVFPWIALALAASFACYSLVKKTISVGPAQGFFVETLLLLPVSLLAVAWFETSRQASFSMSFENMLLLIASGPVTALPLMLFAAGARRQSLSITGLMMYIVPTMIFLTAIFIFKEPISTLKMTSFLIIWAALLIYTVSSFRRA